MTLLVLGGTAEARRIAEKIAVSKPVIYSLAGVTSRPNAPPSNPQLAIRSGGFGGLSGLDDFCRSERIERIVDATHPFAHTMQRTASAAAAPCLRFERPVWEPAAKDQWHNVSDVEEALRYINARQKRRIFLALGAKTLDQLDPDRFDAGCHWLARVVEMPTRPHPNLTLVQGKGPFTRDDEGRFLRDHRIDALVCRNSGGEGGLAKLSAASELRLPVVMINRPTRDFLNKSNCVRSEQEAIDWALSA